MSHQVLRYITLFEPYADQYGYLILFLGLLAENAALPVPGETILLISALYCNFGQLRLGLILPVGIVAAVLGDNVSFYVGRRYGRPFVDRYGRYILISERRMERIEHFFERHGARAIFLQRWITGFRVVGALVAGTTRMGWSRFLFYNLCGAVVWVTTVGLLGYFFALNIPLILLILERSGAALLGLLLLGAIIGLLKIRSRCLEKS